MSWAAYLGDFDLDSTPKCLTRVRTRVDPERAPWFVVSQDIAPGLNQGHLARFFGLILGLESVYHVMMCN